MTQWISTYPKGALQPLSLDPEAVSDAGISVMRASQGWSISG